MIRFSAGLVAVAIGVLIGGVATSKLLLVYIAIGLSAVALVVLAIGVVLKREELFGEQGAPSPAAAGVSAEDPVLVAKTSIQPNGAVDAPAGQVPATASQAGQSPFDQPAWESLARRGTPSARDPLTSQDARSAAPEPPLAMDWSVWASRDAGSRPAQRERAEEDTPAPGRSGDAFRQDPPWSRETPAASASPAPTAPAPAPTAPAPTAPGPVVPGPVVPGPTVPAPPRRESLLQPHGESFGAPAAADYLRAGSPAAASPPDIKPPRAEPKWPSWFERPARPAHETTPDQPRTDKPATDKPAAVEPATDKPAPVVPAIPDETAERPEANERPETAKRPETDDLPDTTDLADGADTSEDDDDWWPRRSWLLDDDESGDSAAAPTAAAPAAETGIGPIPEDEPADAPPAPEQAAEPEDLESTVSEPTVSESTAPSASESTASESTASTAGATAAAEVLDPPAAAETSPSDPDEAGGSEDTGPAAGASDSNQVTVVPGVPRYHEQNCILIRFMDDGDVQKMTVREAAEAGCTPCRACQPDDPTA